MKFKIVSDSIDNEIYPGMIISYRVSPVLKMRVTWFTEITAVVQGYYFIDDQRIGPFKLWHHQHFFREVEGGVEITDIINYRAPYGLIGRFAEWLFVNRRVERIFAYRKKVLKQLFDDTQ